MLNKNTFIKLMHMVVLSSSLLLNMKRLVFLK